METTTGQTAAPTICGLRRIVAGHDWVCVRPLHEDEGPPIPKQRVLHEPPPNRERHHFVSIARYEATSSVAS